MISLQGLQRTYPGGAGVHHVDLNAAAGAVYALVGPNGAGKTTTLGVLTGHLFTRRGTLSLDGRPVPLDRHAPRPGMASVAFDPVLDPALTAWEWLGYAGALRGARPGADGLLWAERLQLPAEALDRTLGTLSDGNRRKAALWSAFQLAERVLVLDEPLTGLDPASIVAFERAVRAYAGAGGTVVLSTHLLPQAERLATHVGMIVGGRTVAEGTVAEVCQGRTLEERFMAEVA